MILQVIIKRRKNDGVEVTEYVNSFSTALQYTDFSICSVSSGGFFFILEVYDFFNIFFTILIIHENL